MCVRVRMLACVCACVQAIAEEQEQKVEQLNAQLQVHVGRWMRASARGHVCGCQEFMQLMQQLQRLLNA